MKDKLKSLDYPVQVAQRGLQDFVPKHDDATAVMQVKNPELLLWGKINMYDLTVGETSVYHAYQPVGNVHNVNYIVGGLSGGALVVGHQWWGIAAGFVCAGLETNTGKSSHNPAALNYIVGFCLTTGHYSNDGLLLILSTRDTMDPCMDLNIADVTLLEAVLSEEELVLQ